MRRRYNQNFWLVLQSDDGLLSRLNTLSPSEIRAMLSRYFEKVINLREAEHKLNLQCSEKEVCLDCSHFPYILDIKIIYVCVCACLDATTCLCTDSHMHNKHPCLVSTLMVSKCRISSTIFVCEGVYMCTCAHICLCIYTYVHVQRETCSHNQQFFHLVLHVLM